jgi:hypothetical protein
MATQPDSHPRTGTAFAAEHLELLLRVASSAVFQKSNRSREFLLYVGRRSLADPSTPIREQEIGVDVFGRSPGYDSSQDTIVRVQGSQLRKKLQQYFAEEGGAEPCVIEMPKGSYTLSFVERESPERRPESRSGPAAARLPLRALWLMGAALAASLAVILVLLWDNHALRRQTEGGMGPRPQVDRLWKQVFGNGRQCHLVLADVALLMLQDAMQRQITLQEYQNKTFRQLAEDRIADPGSRAAILNVLGRNATTMADAAIARRIGFLFSSSEMPLDVILARDATIAMVSSTNTILLGSRRANPWVGLYEDKLNFQTVFNEAPRRASFLNRNPRPGESPEYNGQWSHRGYCRVAFLPSTKGAANVLLISGTDVISTEAGGEFITSEQSVGQLRRSLGLAADAPVPHFEALLETELINNTVSQYRLVAVRGQ